MSRVLIYLLVISFLATAAPAVDPVYFEWEDALGAVPGGYLSYDLMMTVSTNIAQIQMYIESYSPAAGDFYQDPGHEFDTQVMLPVMGDIVGCAINIVPGPRVFEFDDDLLDVAWGVAGGESSTPGTYQVARVTIKSGISGTWDIWGQETGPLPLPEYTLSGTFADLVGALPGDFNDDTLLNALDIDLLRADINTPSGDPKFNVDGIGGVDAADLIYWVEVLKLTKLGDTDLDLKVDGLDATLLGGNWQQSPRGWAQGNFNPDAIVDGLDATLLGGNWQWGVPPPEPPGEPVSAPEPTTVVLLAFGALYLAGRTRRK